MIELESKAKTMYTKKEVKDVIERCGSALDAQRRQLQKEQKRKLQKLQSDILSFLDEYDVVTFAEKHGIKLDNWLKMQLFELMGDIRTKIIMKFKELSTEEKKAETK